MVRTSYNKEDLAVSRTQAQATHNQPQELLAGAKRSSCACIIFGLYCKPLPFSWMEALVMEELNLSAHKVRIFRHDYH